MEPTKITVQYRHEPFLPPQVRIARHYGRGRPIQYFCAVQRPYGASGEAWAETIAEKIRSAEQNGPEPIVLRPYVII